MEMEKEKPKPFVTIRAKMLLSLVLLSLLLIVITAVLSYFMATRQIDAISMQLFEQSIRAIGADMEGYLGKRIKLTDQVIQDQALRAIARQSTYDSLGSAAFGSNESRIARVVNELIFPQGVNDRAFSFVGIYMPNGYIYDSVPGSVEIERNVTDPRVV